MKIINKIIYKNKEFRIIKWEKKPFKDFPMPKGFDWCEPKDFVELYDNDKIKLEVWKSYMVKNCSKKNVKKGWALSRFFLGGGSDLDSYDWYLEYSSGSGRVVVSRELKK